MEYKESEAEFQKKVKESSTIFKKNRPYSLPDDLRDITQTSIPLPDVELVKKDLAQLEQEFVDNKLAGYVDIYKGTHAMLKPGYYLEKYIDTKIRRQCDKWCDNFNYANSALEQLTKKKHVFRPEPVHMIEL